MARFRRLLLTGAAGRLGAVLREGLRDLADEVRLSDITPVEDPGPGEEALACELGDADAVRALTRDVDAVVHMGGVSGEDTFARILNANIVGAYNLYEGCRANGVRRVVWASSNHAIGFYPRTRTIDASVPQRPDSVYGLSKAFGENLAQYYWDKFRIESVSVRIGSCFPEPLDRRMLATWLSHRDLVHLVGRALTAPRVGHTVVYGMSDNDETFWDNTAAAALGFRPRDSAEAHRARLERAEPAPDPDDPAFRWQGGAFAGAGHFEDGED